MYCIRKQEDIVEFFEICKDFFSSGSDDLAEEVESRKIELRRVYGVHPNRLDKILFKALCEVYSKRWATL
nr:MAG TPA: hypothetical protein [Caudoviricetes sp.]